MLSNEIVYELKDKHVLWHIAQSNYLFIRLHRFIPNLKDTRSRTINKNSFLPSFIERHPCLIIEPNGLHMVKKDTVSDIIKELEKYPPLPVLFFNLVTGRFIPIKVEFDKHAFLVEEKIDLSNFVSVSELKREEIPGYYRRKLQI